VISAKGPAGVPVRVVVVDDQQLFRLGLVELLRSGTGIDVVGQAEDGEEAIERVAALLPDVVLIDVRMPRLDGIRATARIVAGHPSVRVVILASIQTDGSVVEALRAGAVGYVLKDADRETLVAAILSASEGRQVLSQGGQQAAVAAALGKVTPQSPPDGITPRQLQILRLMALGLALKQIGRELGVAEKTVRNQASLMYATLRIHDRAQAILYAFHKGLVS
jgi:DNA-binding NarL/FixJ family response regulator